MENTLKKMIVTYTASGQINGAYGGDKESIELSVEIDNFNDYPATLELLRSRVLENLDENIKKKHDELHDEFDKTAQEFLELTQKLESAYKQWQLVSNFLQIQGLKTDNAEFPKEALNSLSKSLPTTGNAYPE